VEEKDKQEEMQRKMDEEKARAVAKVEQDRIKVGAKAAEDARRTSLKAEEEKNKTTFKAEEDARKADAKAEQALSEVDGLKARIRISKDDASWARKSGDGSKKAEEVDAALGVAEAKIDEGVSKAKEASRRAEEVKSSNEVERKVEAAKSAVDAANVAADSMNKAEDALKKAEKAAEGAEAARRVDEARKYEAKYKVFADARISRDKIWQTDSEWYKREFWGSDDLGKRQDKMLKEQVKYIWNNSPYIQKKLESSGMVKPDVIKSRNDVEQLPFTTAEDLAKRQSQYPPYGDGHSLTAEDLIEARLSEEQSKYPRLSLTSKYETAYLYHAARPLLAAGISNSDVVITRYLDSFWAFGLLYEVLKNDIGAAVVPTTLLDDKKLLEVIKLTGASVLMGRPSSLMEMAEVAKTEGVDITKSSIKVLITSGEKGVGSDPKMAEKLEAAWGAKSYEFVGCQDIGIYAWSCEDQSLHLMEDDYIFEVLDPKTKQPVADGAEGELVVTPLLSRTVPVTRYHTGDIVSVVPGVCSCRRPIARIVMKGRVADGASGAKSTPAKKAAPPSEEPAKPDDEQA